MKNESACSASRKVNPSMLMAAIMILTFFSACSQRSCFEKKKGQPRYSERRYVKKERPHRRAVSKTHTFNAINKQETPQAALPVLPVAQIPKPEVKPMLPPLEPPELSQPSWEIQDPMTSQFSRVSQAAVLKCKGDPDSVDNLLLLVKVNQMVTDMKVNGNGYFASDKIDDQYYLWTFSLPRSELLDATQIPTSLLKGKGGPELGRTIEVYDKKFVTVSYGYNKGSEIKMVEQVFEIRENQ